MIEAELRGKLSARSQPAEQSEDALTSAVFGGLRYLEHAKGLFPWLRSAKPYHEGAPPLCPADGTAAHTIFWPQFGDRECDLLLVILRDAAQDLIGVECKFLSGKSAAAGTDELEEHPLLFSDRDQLAYYFAALKRDDVRPKEYIRSQVDRRSILFVTAHYEMPRKEIEDSLRVCRDRVDAGGCFYWLGWRSLWTVLRDAEIQETDPCRLQVIVDLRKLLTRRRLRPFIGFSHLRPFAASAASFRAKWTMAIPRVPRFGSSSIDPAAPDWSRFLFD